MYTRARERQSCRTMIANSRQFYGESWAFFHPFELFEIKSTVAVAFAYHTYVYATDWKIFFVWRINIYLFIWQCYLRCSFSCLTGRLCVICVFNWILLFGVYFNSNVLATHFIVTQFFLLAFACNIWNTYRLGLIALIAWNLYVNVRSSHKTVHSIKAPGNTRICCCQKAVKLLFPFLHICSRCSRTASVF